jgi:hypothetical protein
MPASGETGQDRWDRPITSLRGSPDLLLIDACLGRMALVDRGMAGTGDQSAVGVTGNENATTDTQE